MNLDDLTLGEAKQLAALFATSTQQPQHPFVGRYCVIRTYSAGVHCGILKSAIDKTTVLTSARRIWSWSGAFTLSAVATVGITGGNMSAVVPEIELTETIERIPCSEAAGANLRGHKEHKG